MIAIFKLLIKIIIGSLIGYILGVYIVQRKNVLYHGPDSNEIKKYVFHCSKTNKYYKFTPVPYICPPMYINALKQKFLQQKIKQQQ